MAIQNGDVAVITGGAGGIGLALAREFVARGGRVAIADISLEGAQAAAGGIGDAARAYSCDVAAPESVDDLAKDVLRDFGQVNFVFANAGVAFGGKLHEATPADFDWLFAVNVRGPFNTLKAFLPALTTAADAGAPARLIFTGSENSVGLPSTGEMTAYTATKHAILALADGCRRDLAPSGVKVSIFCPGLVATRLYDSRRSRQDLYGGAAPLATETAEKMEAMMTAKGQAPDVTARLTLDGIERGDFLVITDPVIRQFAETRHAEVEQALDRLDAILAATA